MNGKKEVDADGKKNAGDHQRPERIGAASSAAVAGFGITVRTSTPGGGAHPPRRAERAGPVVVPLTQPADGDPGASSDCVDVADPLAADMLKRPSRYYVNVHTGLVPGGAVRGRLRAQKR